MRNEKQSMSFTVQLYRSAIACNVSPLCICASRTFSRRGRYPLSICKLCRSVSTSSSLSSNGLYSVVRILSTQALKKNIQKPIEMTYAAARANRNSPKLCSIHLYSPLPLHIERLRCSTSHKLTGRFSTCSRSLLVLFLNVTMRMWSMFMFFFHSLDT